MEKKSILCEDQEQSYPNSNGKAFLMDLKTYSFRDTVGYASSR